MRLELLKLWRTNRGKDHCTNTHCIALTDTCSSVVCSSHGLTLTALLSLILKYSTKRNKLFVNLETQHGCRTRCEKRRQSRSKQTHQKRYDSLIIETLFQAL